VADAALRAVTNDFGEVFGNSVVEMPKKPKTA
jgi:hypothetical protein